MLESDLADHRNATTRQRALVNKFEFGSVLPLHCYGFTMSQSSFLYREIIF